MRSDLDLVQGTLDVLVLKTLTWGPRHGYAVAHWIRQTSGDELRVDDGALYTSLHRLEARRLVRAEWGVSENNRRAKYYSLTRAGVKALAAEAANWERLASVIGRVLTTSRGGIA
jgi:PadR family transcriptional regulator PadR